MSTTKQAFNQAVERLLGTALYERLSPTYHPHNFCTEVAQRLLVGRLQDYPEQAADLVLVREVAHRLWHGDGTTGFYTAS